ncbi:SGNH/GDSL hydrolase family protein [Desulfovibrio sp. TomC]|uniref:SGNH/GDSL hydrolase family protein n=1 Tax=Desulfovibrio sp. TomC TaxID=1562888 RepID=UPI000574E22B|nr:GDSL-type esterase/lipase family protein [Desulfovibrio sp. TomC]KHK01821.1 hypothetical protein NY78_2640 [Desulfovibrio sp. TomC]
MITRPAAGGLRRLTVLAGIAVFLACISVHLATRAFWRITDTAPPIQAEPRAYNNVAGDLEPRLDTVSREIPNLPYAVSTDAQGFRSSGPRPAADSRPALRVLCLGDSFTYGVGVNDEQTYPALLQIYLQERFPDRSVEVINAGIPFYDIFDELSYYRDKGRYLAADVVVLQFYSNDLEAMAGSFFRQDLKVRQGGLYNAFDQSIGREAVERRLNTWLDSQFPGLRRLGSVPARSVGSGPARSDPFRAFRLQASGMEKELLNDKSALLSAASVPAMGRFWKNYRQALAMLRNEVGDSGAAFLLVLAPDMDQVREDKNAPAAALVPFCRENAIPLIDLARTLRAMSNGNPDRYFLVPRNGHLNAEGNTILAKSVAEAFAPDAAVRPGGVVVRPCAVPFGYQNPIALTLALGPQGILPAGNGPVSVTPIHNENLEFFSVDMAGGNRIDGLRPDLAHGPFGELLVRLESTVPLDQVTVTLFSRLFAPASGYMELAWSRDNTVFRQLQFASDKDLKEPEGFEASRFSELDLRTEPARQLYLRLRLRDQAWVFAESITPPWRRFEIVCYPTETPGQGATAN